MSQQRTEGTSQTNVQIPLATVEDHWKRIFAKYDKDGDGRIPVREFAEALRSAYYNSDLPAHVVKKIVKKSDLNNDAFISFPEFLEMTETPEGRSLLRGWMNTYVHYTIVPRRKPRVRTATDFIDGEYEDEYSCWPPAICMLLVSILEVVLYAWDFYTDGTDNGTGPIATALIYNPRRRKEVWRYLTYMFVHIGLSHLLVNLLVQIALGIPLEMVHQWWRVLIVYLSGVITGSLTTTVSDPTVYLAGASGGVYALITAHIATIIMNWSEMQFAVWQLLIFVIICSVDVGSSIYTRYVLQQRTQVGYVAHFGGAIAGLLVGLYVLRNLEVRSWEKKIWWTALFIYFILIGGMIAWNIAFPKYFPVQSV